MPCVRATHFAALILSRSASRGYSPRVYTRGTRNMASIIVSIATPFRSQLLDNGQF